jgi:hypothetical protein
MEGLEGYQYKGIRNLREHVNSQSTALMAGRTNQQYLVFRGVTKDELAKIDSKRASIGKHTRMSHYTDSNLLIIKLMPSGKHQISHLTLHLKIRNALIRMGLPDDALTPVGATTFTCPHSSKEGDSGYKPLSRGNETDWPTIILESGLSESLPQLRNGAMWWLANSVKLVILISIEPAQKKLVVEKWCLSPATGYRPATRAHPNSNPLIPTKAQEIAITQLGTAQPGTIPQPTVTVQTGTGASYVVTGAPLILEFQNLLLRTPVPPEGDVVFTAVDLSDWANWFWRSVQ